MATHSSILAWRIPWTEEPGGLESMGFERVTVERLTFLLRFSLLEGPPFSASTVPFSSGSPCYLSDWLVSHMSATTSSLCTTVLGDPCILSICSLAQSSELLLQVCWHCDFQIYSSCLFLLPNSRPSCHPPTKLLLLRCSSGSKQNSSVPKSCLYAFAYVASSTRNTLPTSLPCEFLLIFQDLASILLPPESLHGLLGFDN